MICQKCGTMRMPANDHLCHNCRRIEVKPMEIVRQTYLTFTQGRSNKHYLVALLRDSTGTVYHLYTEHGRIGQTVKENERKSLGSLASAEKAFNDAVYSKTKKGYEKEKPDVAMADETFPKWFNYEAVRTASTPKPQPESATLLRKDAPWAF